MKPVAEYETCVYCPRLCRSVCPVAVGSAREAATPTSMMTGPFLAILGTLEREEAGALASLCTSCGACTSFCKVQRPVGDLLAEARSSLVDAPALAAPGAVEGAAEWVAVECDGRSWAAALARHLKRPVARFLSPDHLGEALLDHPDAFAAYARGLRERLAGRTVVVADLGCQRAAVAAGLSVRHLVELAPLESSEYVFHACSGPRLPGQTVPGALACCGSRAPLTTQHPAIAAEVAASAASGLGGASCATADARCAAALRGSGAHITDPVTALLERG